MILIGYETIEANDHQLLGVKKLSKTLLYKDFLFNI